MCAPVFDRFVLRVARVRLVAMLSVLFAALSGAAATADEKKKPAYDVTVWAIRATKSNSAVSPELRPIAERLKKEFKYTGFKLERRQTARVTEGKTLTANLTGSFKARVTPLERKSKRVKLKVGISKRDGRRERLLARTTFTINSGQFQLQGGWKIDSKSSDVLIVAVSAR